MSALDVEKNPNVEKVKKKKEKEKVIKPLSHEDKRYFSKIRTAIKKQKK